MLTRPNPSFQTRIKRAAKEFAGRNSSGRLLTVLPSDIFITSYPKSGNTWVRFLIANMLYPDGSTDFMNLNQRVPDIYTLPDNEMLSFAEPRYLKSHEYFDPRYPKVLYVVRDVRSVIISYRHHLLKTGRISDDVQIPEFVNRFLAGRLDRYGSWKENVLSWIKVRGDDSERFLLVRYEDLREEPHRMLSQMCDFLGSTLNDDAIEQVISWSAFDRMKLLEKAGIDPRSLNAPSKAKSSANGFVRSGQTKNWQEALGASELDAIYADCGSLLEELGYEL